jgi:hypothetical protein
MLGILYLLIIKIDKRRKWKRLNPEEAGMMEIQYRACPDIRSETPLKNE